MARAGYPQIKVTITHLRHGLGDNEYKSFALAGESLTIAAMTTYSLAQIDQARAELDGDSKSDDI